MPLIFFGKSRRSRSYLAVFLSACIAVILTSMVSISALGDTSATITVSGNQSGISTTYMGADSGEAFNIDKLNDLNFNSFHVYIGAGAAEPYNFDGDYGSLTPDKIKANPNALNWSAWDNKLSWLDQFFKPLSQYNYRVLTVVQHQQDGFMPTVLSSDADFNEFWKLVFAIVYEANVRHSYRIDDWAVANEPDINGMTKEQLYRMFQVVHDAIDHIYKTYLPGRKYHIWGPSISWKRDWVSDSLANAKSWFDGVDFHDYSVESLIDPSSSGMTPDLRSRMNANGVGDWPLWVSEWNDGLQPTSSIANAIKVTKGIIAMSQPGPQHIDGWQYFQIGDNDGLGLLDKSGNPRLRYYAMRIATRALVGGKPVFEAKSSNSDINAIATKDGNGTLRFSKPKSFSQRAIANQSYVV